MKALTKRPLIILGKGPKKYTGPNTSGLKHHKEAKEALKGKRAELLRELLETGSDIIQCRQEYGQLYNSRSFFSRLPNEVVALIFSAVVTDGRITGVRNPLVFF